MVGGAPRYVEGEIIVRLRPEFAVAGVTTRDAAAGFEAATAALGARVVDSQRFATGGEMFRLQLPVGVEVDQAVQAYKSSRFVEYAEPNYLWFPDALPSELRFDRQWGMHNVGQDFSSIPSGGSTFGERGLIDADIDAPEAWDFATDASSVIVAVIDTGINAAHPDLVNNMWTNPGEIPGDGIDNDDNGFIDDVHGWDFHNDRPLSFLLGEDNHGTHVAGTIGAEGDNGIQVAGVAWKAQIMSCKFIGPAGGSTWDAIDALYYAAQMGAAITNNSWGGGGYSQALAEAIVDTGMLFVSSAGNTATDNDVYPHYPSSYSLPNMISVAASDWNDNLANFSCWGAESVDIAAPGHWIISTYGPAPNGSTMMWMGGTSMATPHVTGAAALVSAYHPDLPLHELATGYVGGPTVKELILRSSDPKPSFEGKMTTGGRLNLYNALTQTFPLRVNVTADVTFGSAPLTVNFSAQVDRPGDVVLAEWRLGSEYHATEGFIADGFATQYVFEEEGSYIVWFLVVASDGSATDWPVQVVVANPGTIICVDDDGGQRYTETFFLADANDAGFSTVRVDARFPLGLPDNFTDRMLVWDTALSWSDTLMPDQEEFLGRFLDNGGRLLMLSADYLYELGVTPFAQQYLHIDDTAGDFGIAHWRGVDGDPITDGMDFMVNFGTYVADWLYPGLNARSILINDDYGFEIPCAIRYADETHRVVFSTMPWLEIPWDDADPNNTYYLLTKIYDYLMGEINIPPTITEVSSSLRFALVGEEVTFTAGARDAEGGSLTYEWDFDDAGDPVSGAVTTKAFEAPGLYNVWLTVTDEGGEYSEYGIDVAVLEQGDVVYVFDEDAKGDAGTQLSDALKALTQGYVEVESSMLIDGVNPRAGLNRFRVVWNCGELGGIDDDEQVAIADYLDDGGGLLLIGQEVMFSLEFASMNGPAFAGDYLHVTDVEHDVGSTYVTGVAESIISGEGYIDLEFPADYDDWTDNLVIDGSAQAVLLNDSDQVCALSYSGDDRRLVFMAAAYEAMNPTVIAAAGARGYIGDLSPIDPLTLLGNILEWLNRPEVTVTSPVAGELYTGTATIEWEAPDPLGETFVISLQYSRDGGTTWVPIKSGEANDGSYGWDTASLPSGGAYMIRVTATKAGDYSGYGDSGEFFVSVVQLNALSGGPNPAREAVNFYVNPTSQATLYVYDIAGRKVFSHEFPEGEITFTWDLTNSGGAALPNGLYLCYVLTEDGVRSDIMRLVISR